MQKRYHLCQSIAGLERLIAEDEPITWLMVDGRVATMEEIDDAIKDAKAKGYTVIPPCSNVKSSGCCAGHDVPPERIASCVCGFERIVMASAEWTEMPILVVPPPPAKPFFPACKDCELRCEGEEGIAIMPDDLDVFHPVKICLIRFKDMVVEEGSDA